MNDNCCVIELPVLFCCGTGEGDGCTNGFISIERMNQVLDNHVVGAVWDQQAIVPEINFTCNGNIQTLLFGANLRNGMTEFPEFQLWRRSGSSSVYRVVDRITYNETDREVGQLYRLQGDPLLQFEAGDILGFYQPSSSTSRLRLQQARRIPQPLQGIYRRSGNSSKNFNAMGSFLRRNLVVSVVTGKNFFSLSECAKTLFHTEPANCSSGFMSEEILRTLLGLEGVGRLVGRIGRQQITPGINFTCDGFITKWIIGALRAVNSTLIPGPELQLWRNTVNDTYVKISGTFITANDTSSSLIYETSDFSPIPFQAGDILGIFTPNAGGSSLRLRSELGYGPLNFFSSTDDDAATSPFVEIQLSNFTSSEIYHPLVSLEISIPYSDDVIMTSSLNNLVPESSIPLASTRPAGIDSTTPLVRRSSTFNPSVSEPYTDVTMQSPTTRPAAPDPTTPPYTSTTDDIMQSPTTRPAAPDPTTPPYTSTTDDIMQSPTPPPSTSPPHSRSSQSSSLLGPGIGGGVGGALLLALLLATGGALLLVWIRRKRSAKVVLQQVSTNLSNPVYDGECVWGGGGGGGGGGGSVHNQTFQQHIHGSCILLYRVQW